MAEVIPGSYDALPDRLNLLLDPSISPQALDALRGIAERLQRNEITPEQAKQEAEKVAPKAARLFDVAEWSDTAKATLYAAVIGAVAVVTAAVITRNSGESSPPVVIERVIDRQTERLRNSTALPYIPTPTPRPK